MNVTVSKVSVCFQANVTFKINNAYLTINKSSEHGVKLNSDNFARYNTYRLTLRIFLPPYGFEYKKNLSHLLTICEVLCLDYAQHRIEVKNKLHGLIQ